MPISPEVRWRVKQIILRSSGFGAGEAITHGRIIPDDRSQPTWPSGIEDIETKAGGFSGCTAIAGAPKLGKSMLALRSALLAAERGWTTFYFDGENAQQIIAQRVTNFFGRSYTDWPDWVAEHFRFRWLEDQATIFKLADHVAEHITERNDRVLVVIDSINRLAKGMDAMSERPGLNTYFRHLNQITGWGSQVARHSRGEISVLLISELNRRGEATGQNIEYATDQILYLRKGDEPRRVKMELVSRATEGGDLGEYVRSYTRCGFFKQPLYTPDRPDAGTGRAISEHEYDDVGRGEIF
jgi:predicted ATP-dependent serine protease